MNKSIAGLLVGLLVGAGATWLWLRHSDHADAKAEHAAEKPAEKPNPLRLSAEKRAAAGIVLAKPTAATLPSEVQAFGRVLDPAPFVTLVAEAETARAAATASAKELARVQKLFAAGGNASAQAVEAAEAAAARDQAAVASARARLLASWGRELAGADLPHVIAGLEQGSTLARLDMLPGEAPAAAPKAARVSLAGGTEQFDAEVLGVAPVADPQVTGSSFLALVKGRALPAGASLRAILPGTGEARPALVVPRSAIVYHQGSAWVYVLGEEDTFERKLVEPGPRLGDGVAISGGVDADEQVVTTGAQQLLAAELQAGGPAGEG